MRVETIGDATLYLGDCMEVLPTLGKFDVLCYIEVPDFQAVERKVHGWLQDSRISQSREFFYCCTDFAIRLLYHYPHRVAFCDPKNNTPPLLDCKSLAASIDPFTPRHVPANESQETEDERVIREENEDADKVA